MDPGNTRYEKRKEFLENLKLLVKSEYEEIFRILKRADIQLSENSNGIFFDVTSLSDEIFDKVTSYIELCKSQRQEEASRAKTLDELRTATVKHSE